MTASFQRYIGIDYSGADSPTKSSEHLQIFVADGADRPQRLRRLIRRQLRHWSRESLTEKLIELLQDSGPAIVGIDHAFSFPIDYFRRYGLPSWESFLSDFYEHWPTDWKWVRDCREGNERTGSSDEFRLTERWTASAKSVFQFGVNGEVATSTHAGLPWLLRIRKKLGDNVHFWPFDGWEPPDGKSVIVEVYPALLKNRFELDSTQPDQKDAEAVAWWLQERDLNGFLPSYFNPLLTDAERKTAELEGWIIGLI